MAKYDWSKIRDDYEIKGMSYSKISSKYGVSKSTISARAKKDAWDKEKSEQIITEKMNNIKAMREIEQKSEQVFGSRSLLIHTEVEERLRREGYFDNSIEECQEILNAGLRAKDKDALMLANMHSQATCRNRDAMLGKTPQTQVNIQNNVGSDADAIVERLMKKHQ